MMRHILQYSMRKRHFRSMAAITRTRGCVIGFCATVSLVVLTYYLKWEDGSTRRGLFHGRRSPTGESACMTCTEQDGKRRREKAHAFSKKINEEGDYLRYLGYTVISKLDPKIGKDIEKILEQTTRIRQYVSFFPHGAYFIEINKIFVHDPFRPADSPAWEVRPWLPDDVHEARFLRMRGAVWDVMTRAEDACLRHGQPFRGTFGEIRASHQPGFPFRVLFTMVEDFWVARLKKNLNQIFQTSDQRSTFHLNLGYMYRKFPDDLNEWRLIQDEIHAIRDYLFGQEANFMAPRVHVFSDMTCHVPLEDFLDICGKE